MSRAPRPLARRLLGGRARRWFLLALAAGVLWRVVRYAVVFPMWGDEAFVAVNVLVRDFGGMLRPLEHDVVAPLGFLWAEVGARSLLGPGEAALRFVPFVAGLLAFLLFARLARERLSRPVALLATAWLAASYYPVRHAAEVKPYALDLLVAVPILWIAWRVLEEPPVTRRWAALALVSAVGVWFSWTAAFVAGGAWLALAFRVGRPGGGVPDRGAWIFGGAAVAASFLAAYAVVGSGQQWSEATATSSGQWSEHFPPFSEPWRLPLWFVSELTGNMAAYPNGGRAHGAAGTTLLAALGAVSLWRSGRRDAVRLLLAPLVPMFVAAALRKYPFGGSARTTLHLAVPVCILAAVGLLALVRRVASGRRTVLVSRAAAVVLAAAAVGGAAMDVARPYKKAGDASCRTTIRSLAERTAPGDRWLVFGDFAAREGVPDLRAWGGSAARLRYQLLRRRGETPLLWGPRPDALPPWPGRTWVISYLDDEVAPPVDDWDRWIAGVARGRKPEFTDVGETGEGPEAITIYRLPP